MPTRHSEPDSCAARFTPACHFEQDSGAATSTPACHFEQDSGESGPSQACHFEPDSGAARSVSRNLNRNAPRYQVFGPPNGRFLHCTLAIARVPVEMTGWVGDGQSSRSGRNDKVGWRRPELAFPPCLSFRARLLRSHVHTSLSFRAGLWRSQVRVEKSQSQCASLSSVWTAKREISPLLARQSSRPGRSDRVGWRRP
jgi:hypothetical protein